MRLKADSEPIVLGCRSPWNSCSTRSACEATLHNIVRRMPLEGEVVTVCPPMSRPDDLLFGPVADCSSKTNRGLIFPIADRLVEVRQGFSLRLAVVELTLGVLAIAIAIPVDATDFGKGFMPFVARSSIWAAPLCKSAAEELRWCTVESRSRMLFHAEDGEDHQVNRNIARRSCRA